MKKLIKVLLKIISGIVIAFVVMIVGLCILNNAMHTVKPSVRQLEKACGVKYPAFSIVNKELSIGSCHNYEYTVKFKKMPGKEVFDRIEYLCKNGNVIEDPLTGKIENPWNGGNGHYVFSIQNSDNHAGYHFPFNVRWMTIRVGKDSDLMYISYSLDD